MRRPSGFTLGELLVSMALLAALTLMVMRLVTGGIDLWRRGQEVMDLLEQGSAVSDLVCRDLRQLRGSGESEAVEGRLLCAPMELEREKPPLDVVRFLRRLQPWEEEGGPPPEEAEAAAGERSPFASAFGPGTGAGPGTGKESGPVEPGPALSTAPGGAALVFYCTGPSVYEGELGEKGVYLSLRRGEIKGRDIGPGNGLFRRRPFEKKEDFELLAESVFEGLLHFGIRFWSQTTTSWEGPPRAGGSELYWDSTRGGGTWDEEKGEHLFSLDLGPYSLDWPRDDLFPRLILLEMVVELPPREARCAILRTALDGKEKAQLLVDYPERLGLPGDRGGMVKIGSEWIAYSRIEGGFLRGLERGARRTRAGAHQPGARVHSGWTVHRLITPAQNRQWWGPVAPLPPQEER